MSPTRPLAALVFASTLLGVGCATQTPERRAVPEPPATVLRELDFHDVVRFGQDYALAEGYEVAEVAEAVEVRPNYWRVRFGLAPRGSGRLLEVEFDEAQRRVVTSTEIGGAVGGAGPTP
jgi:hypothetical protein